MRGKNFIPHKGQNLVKRLNVEKYLLNKHFDFLEVKILTGNILKCVGYSRPSEFSVTYKYEVRFIVGQVPKVYVVDPIIEYNPEIHMYSADNSLCLYYPQDFSWQASSNLYNTIIPWTHEWLLFYELFQITGKWHHPFVEHNKSISNEF
jgi:hypothetical protein